MTSSSIFGQKIQIVPFFKESERFLGISSVCQLPYTFYVLGNFLFP